MSAEVSPIVLVCTPIRLDHLTQADQTWHEPPPLPPEWRTETVLALHKGIQDENAFDRFPILADALEEAGCTDVGLLQHCRLCEEHSATCWVLEAICPKVDPPLAEALPTIDLPPTTEWSRFANDDHRMTAPPEDRGTGHPWLILWVILGVSVSVIRACNQSEIQSLPTTPVPKLSISSNILMNWPPKSTFPSGSSKSLQELLAELQRDRQLRAKPRSAPEVAPAPRPVGSRKSVGEWPDG